MGAPKGNTNHLGQPHTLESRQRMSATKKGKHYSPATEFKKGQVAPMKGRKRPDLIGNTTGFKKGQPAWNKGKAGVFHHSEETKLKISRTTQGAGGNNWKGGITPQNHIDRNNSKYRAWRDAVFAKDNFTCQVCESYGDYVHADHIKPWANHPELRYEVDNGRTLCRACHYYITFKRKLPITSKWGLARKR